MDFDEYEYLEKTAENPQSQKLEQAANGGEVPVKSADKDRRLSSRHREEDDDDLDPKSKRSRTVDDARGRDRHRDKSSSRHRSRSREVERGEKDGEKHKSSREHRDREKERGREERNGRDHDRDREKDRERERGRDSGRKERHRDKESEKDKDKDERGSRSRSHVDRHQNDGVKSRDREHTEKSQDKEHRGKSRDLENMEKSLDREHREKSRDQEYREKSRDRDPRDRESRRHKEKKDETTEPEADPERDQRTVFAYQLPLRADERDIFEFFSSAGKVRDVRLIMDRSSRRSKGVGYIEFYDVMSVPMAIALSGQLIRGVPVMVKPSEAEKNLVQSTSAAAGGASLTGSGAARKLYVGNLVPNITEEQIRVVFETFGTIELVQLPRDETGLCKGFAFVQFSRVEDAKSAQTLNGQLDIGGRYIKVSAVTDQPGMQDVGATNGDLDDDEGGGLALNASSRALLMQKLDRSGSAPSAGGPLASTGVNTVGFSASSAPMFGSAPVVSPMLGGMPSDGHSIPPVALPTVATIGVPSECLLLTNMFDPKVETEPDFDLDIKDDVQDECAKFGSLKHIFVDKFSDGHVYLKFDDTRAAMNAQQALHGRWFAGKMITATFMIPQNYEAKFPESR
ncbi:hypothetical protein RND81_11G149300 [Saponaria officinalis]|uniref:RRM domain-containing protein n=2 Tax=Saponaria officinalis TaxID=3572 RepID=A0AAW1HMB2_SAPOF